MGGQRVKSPPAPVPVANQHVAGRFRRPRRGPRSRRAAGVGDLAKISAFFRGEPPGPFFDSQSGLPTLPPPRDTAWAMSEENVELARKAIDALNRGDLDAWLAFLSPDVVWEALPGVPGLGELYRGRAEVRDWIEQLFELAEGGIHTEIEQLTDLGDDRVFLAIVLTARGRGSGVPFEMPNWEVIWFAEGLVTRRQIFWTRDEALEAAGLSE
jgi:ketosteroid isomerase-like protein